MNWKAGGKLMHEPKRRVMQAGLAGGIVMENAITDEVWPCVLSRGIETLDAQMAALEERVPLMAQGK